jgi:mRNA interferase RelE/StbE
VFEIAYRRQPKRYLINLPRNAAERIVERVEAMAAGEPADIMPITGQPGYFRLRVGGFRVIFRRDNDADTIVITWMGPRGDAY